MEEIERCIYPAVLTFEPGQEISVVFPDLGVATSGEDENDALAFACELLEITMTGLEEDHAPIPAPTPLAELKIKPNERAVRIDVSMPPLRKAARNRPVECTVEIPVWLDEMAQKAHIDLSKVLEDALKQRLHI